MKRLNVYIEISGEQIYAGSIAGNNQYDAVFKDVEVLRNLL